VEDGDGLLRDRRVEDDDDGEDRPVGTAEVEQPGGESPATRRPREPTGGVMQRKIAGTSA
jgi:hypothetical protein